MKVRDVMSSEVISVRTDTSIRRIVELLEQHRISGLPVVDDHGRVIGVVSEGDLVVKEHRSFHVRLRSPLIVSDQRSEHERRAQGEVAGEVMTSPAVSVDQDADLRVAARMMSLYGVRRLPVTRDDRLVGIVSRRDVLQAFRRPDEDIRKEIVEIVLAKKILDDTGNVTVEVHDGVVTLQGVVERLSIARSIGFHVERLDGVTKINDEVRFLLDDLVSPVHLDPPPVGPLEQIL